MTSLKMARSEVDALRQRIAPDGEQRFIAASDEAEAIAARLRSSEPALIVITGVPR